MNIRPNFALLMCLFAPLTMALPAELKIPVEFLPAFDNKNQMEYAQTDIVVRPSEVAVVLVDAWEVSHPKYANHLRASKTMLKQARKYGLTVIHAPSYPTVNEYPQFKKLKKEAEEYYGNKKSQPTQTKEKAVFGWPPDDLYKKLYSVRSDLRDQNKSWSAKKTPKVSKHVKPQSGDYVLHTENQLRYVLWKHKIKVVIYGGSSIMECVLFKPAGIMSLYKNYDARSNFVIVAMRDMIAQQSSPGHSAAKNAKAIFDLLAFKPAFIGNSSDIVWPTSGKQKD